MAVPVMWRTQKQRYSLQAEVCTHCSSAVFPPRAVCPYCKAPMRVQVSKAAAAVTTPQPAVTQGREFVFAMPAPAAAAVAVAAGDD